MWFYFLFISVGLIALVGMGAIVVRKFPILSILNAEDLPEEQEAKRKKEILQGRVARKATELGRHLAKRAGEHATKAGHWMQATKTKLEAMEQQFHVGDLPSRKAPNPQERVVVLMDEAKRFEQLGDLVNAEEKYVEAISWDAKDERSYRALADLYLSTKRHGQALETLDFLTKILRREYACRHTLGQVGECAATPTAHADLSSVLAQAGAAATAGGELAAAAERYAMAAVIMPMNPRYLDLLIEARLALGDKAGAAEALEALRHTNPDNQKIPQFQAKIEGLPERA
jgi:tetratricopeptide (TPR) repeat protein